MKLAAAFVVCLHLVLACHAAVASGDEEASPEAGFSPRRSVVITHGVSQARTTVTRKLKRLRAKRNSVATNLVRAHGLSWKFLHLFLGPDAEHLLRAWNFPFPSPEQFVPELNQLQTNGGSRLGTREQKYFPRHLLNNPLPNGFPWSNLNANTDYYHNYPRTGVIRSYDFTVSRGVLAPDGYLKEVLLVNGQFPGPTIEANWGDTIQVTQGTPWEDGVPGVTECPIPPGESFTYVFDAQLYGTSWWHSHYSAQWAGGVFGAMVIYGPETVPYDIDVGPILIGDYYHKDYFTLVEETLSPSGGIFLSDNNLINGKNVFNCSHVQPQDRRPCNSRAGAAVFEFERGKVHRLRLINSGAEALQRFSIDGHRLLVIANDFVPVEPYETSVVTLGIGQRSDVLVRADGNLDSYWMRANISEICSLTAQPHALAVIDYVDRHRVGTRNGRILDFQLGGGGVNSALRLPRSVPVNVPDPGTCANDPLSITIPVMKLAVPEPDLTWVFDMDTFVNGSDITLWRLGGVSERTNYNSPTLLLSNLGNYSFDPIWNVRAAVDLSGFQRAGGNLSALPAARSVRIVVNNNSPVPHPMHLHGFNMMILNEGFGRWDGTIVRPQNPQRRDVQMVRKGGYFAMQFNAIENPGVWMFHCHIAWHASAGLLMQILTNPRDVRRFRIPNTVADTCRQWARWTRTNIPDQIDSGL